MKKSTIGIMIAAVSMIVVGGGMFVGGLAAAGGIESVKETLTKHGVPIDEEFRIDAKRSEQIEETQKKGLFGKESITFDMEDVESLHLEVKEAEVEITNSGDDEISIQTDGGYRFYVKNKVLYIEPEGIQKENQMLIELPEQLQGEYLFKETEIYAGASQIIIEQISAKEFELEAGAGQVEIEQLLAEHAEFDIGAGEVIVNDGEVQECESNVDMGNFAYTGTILKYGSVECNMGNAEYHLERDVDEYNYEIECGAGNVDIGNESFSGLGTEQYIDNHVQEYFEIECSMGNVSID